MRGHITYAPLIGYLRSRGIPAEEFRSTFDIDDETMDHIVRNEQISFDLIERICGQYNLPLSSVMCVDSELRSVSLLVDYTDRKKKPTVREFFENPEGVITGPTRIDCLMICDNRGSILVESKQEVAFKENPAAFAQMVNDEDDVYSPGRFRKFCRTILPVKNPEADDIWNRLVVTQVISMVNPVFDKDATVFTSEALLVVYITMEGSSEEAKDE